MKKINIFLAMIFVFFLSPNLAIAKSECDDLLGNKMSLNMTVGFGKMYFLGYNHGKGTNIKYSKSKMEEFIRVSCAADPTIEIEKIFANAADTNFKLPKIKKGGKQTIDWFFIRVDPKLESDEVSRRCLVQSLKPKYIKAIDENIFPKLEKLRKKEGSKKYSNEMFKEILGKDFDDFFKLMGGIAKKCGLK